MHDSRSVDLVVRLPVDVAESVQDVSRSDPDYLNRVLRYGLARRAVFQELRRALDRSGPDPASFPAGSA
ncbi:MAG: hypothetical protein RRA92_03810 [Gemmatimonadota bacterium]|nr:hypothetical protein [Gemmatimonadota bacterium]